VLRKTFLNSAKWEKPKWLQNLITVLGLTPMFSESEEIDKNGILWNSFKI